MHLVSSFWLPLPFLTRREVDRDDQKAELWFLVILHSLENFCMLLLSRWAYNSYPLWQFHYHILVAINIFAVFFAIINRKTLKVRGFVLLLVGLVALDVSAAFVVKALVEKFEAGVFVIDLCLVIVNVLAIIVSVIYQDYVKLYAGLPQTFPDLPSFGPEVSNCYEILSSIMCHKTNSINIEDKDDNNLDKLWLVCVQDVPAGPVVEAKREDSEVVEEGQELADAGQLVQQVMWVRPS